MKFKIGEKVYIDKGKQGKIVEYSEVSHRYKVKLDPGYYVYLQDCDMKKMDESWRKK